MRVLLISNTYPADPDRAVHGIYQRLETFVRAMHGHRIEALFFVPDGVATGASAVRVAEARLADAWDVDIEVELQTRAPVATGRWETYFAGMFSLFGQARYRLTSGDEQVAAVRRRLAAKPDVIFVHRLTAMAPLLRLPSPRAPVLFDLDDVEHVAFERSTRIPPLNVGKQLLRFQLPALRRGERRAIERADVTFVCSDSDRRYLRKQYQTDTVETVPNSVPIPPPGALSDGTMGSLKVLFLGNYAHPPNRVAADRLAGFWPDVRRRVPGARLVLAGPKSELLDCRENAPPGTEFPGFVDNLGRLYEGVAVVCTPIFEGGGTRIKLLEAGAWGRGIVATETAAEGIGFEDGVHFVRGETDSELAEACVALLRDAERRARLGAAARQLISARYSRDAVTELARNLMERHGLPPIERTEAGA